MSESTENDNETKDEAAAPVEVDPAYVAALTREAEGYAAAGREHRLVDVNAELKRLGAPQVKPGKGEGKQAAEKRQRRG